VTTAAQSPRNSHTDRDVNSKTDHFNGKQFFNPGAPQAKGLMDVLRWKWTSRPTPWADTERQTSTSVPPRTVEEGTCRITFVNHSTVLIQSAGQNILTDPIWSERASPFSWAGPKRRRQPGVRFEDLPPIHLVLLSHNHYDHFDATTLQRLAETHSPKFVVPLGLSPLLRKYGITSEPELDWWDTAGNLTCTPARHFSARGMTDRNRTLWCSYHISTAAGDIYFGADSGFGPHYGEIRERLGAPQLALLPIGAYRPEWFMSPVHMSPAQAVEAHQILGAERSIAIHWGTFRLADDGEREPVDDLHRALAQAPDARPFEVLENGSFVEISG
jgi:L-ascorbate metabolism protein UlaG (beta-lactamase superfamily)